MGVARGNRHGNLLDRFVLLNSGLQWVTRRRAGPSTDDTWSSTSWRPDSQSSTVTPGLRALPLLPPTVAKSSVLRPCRDVRRRSASIQKTDRNKELRVPADQEGGIPGVFAGFYSRGDNLTVTPGALTCVCVCVARDSCSIQSSVTASCWPTSCLLTARNPSSWTERWLTSDWVRRPRTFLGCLVLLSGRL